MMRKILAVVFALLLSQAPVHCNFYKYTNFKKIYMNLTGYEQDGNGNYPHTHGVKYGSILLFCHVTSLLKIKDIHWLRNNKKINPPPYSLPWRNGNVLMIRPLLEGRTDGVYECVASNKYNTVTKGVNITVLNRNQLSKKRFQGFPIIRTHPTHVRTLRNQVDFHCVVSGQAPLKIIWFHNRAPLPANEAFNVSPTTNIGNTFSSNLMIRNVTKETRGFYQCAAMNSIGHVVSNQGNMQFRGNSKRSRRSLQGLVYQGDCQKAVSKLAINVTTLRVTATCGNKSPNIVGEYVQEVTWTPPNMENKENNYVVRFEKLFHQEGGMDSFSMCRTPIKGLNIVKFPFNTSLIYNVTVFELEPDGTVTRVGTAQTVHCPKEINAYDMKNVRPPIEAGTNFTFTAKFSGQPKPRVNNWYFSPDMYYCDTKLKVVYNGLEHISISPDRRSLTVVNATKKEEGCYMVEVTNDITRKRIKGYLRVQNKVDAKKNMFGPALGGITGGLFLIVFAIMVYKRYMDPKPRPQVPPVNNPAHSVYISHNVKGKQSEIKVLKFANFLQQNYAIQVNLDLTAQVEINKLGGMCNWVPKAMERSDKVIIILTSSYLKALKQQKEADDDVCKVSAEFTAVKKIIYHDLQRTSRIIILSDDEVRPDKFPDPLKGRSYFPFPECHSADDIDLYKIACVLSDMEMIQLPSQMMVTDT